MIKNNYLYTKIYTAEDDISLENDSIYIYGHSVEGRSSFVDRKIITNNPEITFIELKKDAEKKDYVIDSNTREKFFLRKEDSIKSFYKQYSFNCMYLDCSGLDSRVCASLLNNAFKIKKETNPSLIIKIFYAEPSDYKIYEFSKKGHFHNLSEDIDGIEPLPGFASILPDSDKETYLVALLGFEGGRFTYVLENSHPTNGEVFPVIGVPGYRIQYPFVAYWGNRRALENKNIWPNVRYVSANSVFEVFQLLQNIHSESPSGKLKVAIIGTKPHGIGAILYAIKEPYNIEIIYDNPIRKTKRTEGVGKVIEWNVSEIIS
jgi:hypothetical protein